MTNHTATTDSSYCLVTTAQDIEIGDTITIYDPVPELVVTVEKLGTLSSNQRYAFGTTQHGSLATVIIR